ncbi:UNVERIFIED_CONTAM: Chaperone protein DnaJ [Sesamum calycinum]|uniref:Chaperone protein DnaJ n=1 Tax=Sesamum calycinum TaxID=2727403 RepID=A0AAW2J075_9LAMI
METNIEEALRVKALAEKQFATKDFIGAQNYALKAQMLCPELEGISQMVATFGVYIASEAKINGECDFYSILGLDPSADKSKLKKQYKKLAVLLHPDKNRTVGADGAFRLVSEAWTLLSDSVKRSSYDQRRNLFAGYSTGAGGYDNCSKFSASHSTLDTFWTVCTSCHVQYEYLRKYVNKRLSCKNCRGVFVAVETGLAPVSGSFPYSTYSYAPENGYGSHGCGVAYIPKTTGYCAPAGPPGHHAGYRSEYASNISFQGTSSINSVGIVDPNGLSTSSFVFYQANEEANKAKANGTHNKAKGTGHMASNGYTGQDDVPKPRRGRPSKKRKMDLGISVNNRKEEIHPDAAAEAKIINVNGTLKPALSSPPETSTRRCSAVPAFDVRQVLIDKARSEIHRKLEEMRLASQVAAEEAEKRNTHAEVDKSKETVKVSGATGAGFQSELKRTASLSITVPDSDFHNFDQGRSEECFKPKQIWALYDEEDGMPRLYCIIREVISLNPFKIYISYLSSKSDCEFGSVNWLDSGFTKSCGSFRVFHSETVEQVNIFSHLLSREKAGRGGCVRIYPRGGDIWAVYRNWSPDWNRTTPDEVRHQYEMVEVLEDYSEENGVWVTPLIKLSGYKTVYQRNANTSAIRWIPRREMLRFSHQVPSCSLKVEGINLPEGCWDLDPAATPDELLQGETEPQNNISPGCAEKSTETPPNNQFSAEPEGESEEKLSQSQSFASTPVAAPQVEGEACPEKRKPVELFEGQERTQAELPQGDFTTKAAAELSRTEAIANI